MITRSLSSALARASKSLLLLGPRQTGKSTLVSSLRPDVTIDLAHEATFLDFAGNPLELEQRLKSHPTASTVFIDEVQRLPSLLNTVQFILDRHGKRLRFYLTGSSARKLRRGHANLLPGRIFTFYLGPLTCEEMGYAMDAEAALSTGTLPGIMLDTDRAAREKTLRSYAATYLKEEVQAEALTRNLEGFARFLQTAAEWSGRFLDLSKMASSAQVPRQSAVRYFEILEDCLVVHRVESFSKSATRRLIQHPKFYFFDVGVLNGLLANFSASADRRGALFEHLIATQILHACRHADKEIKISTFRTEHGAEIDLIVEIGREVLAIEAKASRTIASHDVRSFKSFEEHIGKKYRGLIFYLGDARKKIGNIEVLPWQEGVRAVLNAG